MQNIKERNKLDKPWKYKALKEFKENLTNEQFPCLFGRKSVFLNSFIPVFCDSNDEQLDNLFSSLIKYTDFVKKTDIKKRIFMPLIIFFDQELIGEKWKNQTELAWGALNLLHARDPEKWPDTIPIHPDDTNWCYCFNGVQLFFNMSFKHHYDLKSRNLGKNLTFIINPRENFDFVASGKKGTKIRKKIRDRVFLYNNGHVPKELGFYGDGSKEWEQYQLEEKNFKSPQHCPFKFIKKEI